MNSIWLFHVRCWSITIPRNFVLSTVWITWLLNLIVKFVFNCFLCDLNTIKLHFLTLKYTWRRAFPEKKNSELRAEIRLSQCHVLLIPNATKIILKWKLKLRCSGLTVKTKLFTYRRFKEGRCPTKILCHLNTHLHLINYSLNLCLSLFYHGFWYAVYRSLNALLHTLSRILCAVVLHTKKCPIIV